MNSSKRWFHLTTALWIIAEAFLRKDASLCVSFSFANTVRLSTCHKKALPASNIDLAG